MRYLVILVIGLFLFNSCERRATQELKRLEAAHIMHFINGGNFREDLKPLALDFGGLPLNEMWFNALSSLGHLPSAKWHSLSSFDPNYHPTCLSEPLLAPKKTQSPHTKADYIVSDYIKNLHHSVLYSRVGDHGVSLSPLAVRKASLNSDTVPTISIYPDFYAEQQKGSQPTLASKVSITTYEADGMFLLRGVMTDLSFPVRCFDVIWSPLDGKPIYGQLYYYDGQVIKSSVFKPSKPV